MNGDALVQHPSESVQDAAGFLGLLNDPASSAALERVGPLTYHAKDPQMPFDAAMRAVELADAEQRHGDEVEAAIAWAQAVANGWLAQSPMPVA